MIFLHLFVSFHILNYMILFYESVFEYVEKHYTNKMYDYYYDYYLSSPLQVAKVDIWDKEDRLGLQVSHGFKESCVGLLGNTYHTHTSVFPWTPAKGTEAVMKISPAGANNLIMAIKKVSLIFQDFYSNILNACMENLTFFPPTF